MTGWNHGAFLFEGSKSLETLTTNSILKRCGCFLHNTSCTSTKTPLCFKGCKKLISFWNWSQSGTIQTNGHGTWNHTNIEGRTTRSAGSNEGTSCIHKGQQLWQGKATRQNVNISLQNLNSKIKNKKRPNRRLAIISAIVVFHRNPNLSDERDLERFRFLSPDEDLERLRFCPLSGEEEGEGDFFRGEEPFPDLELDLLEE